MLKFRRINPFIVKTIAVASFVGFCNNISAKEGMWLPPTLPSRENDMKAMGLEIPIEKLYNTDGTGLNNAVVLFGKGCTGEMISAKGLILTNHHCGYGTVQGLSSKQNDYFADGFWAMSNQDEIPCPGLTVTFIRRMENVSPQITDGLADTMDEKSRDAIVAVRIKNLEKGYKVTTGLDAMIKPYFNGNQYWVILSETYRDIRLVGFPPNGIGQFGGDTDNWMWPRHTGDFSMFRIYAGKDNKPADYDKLNKPYQSNQFFTINISGYKEGDFTMVYGFPGSTQEYISSSQLHQIYSILDPIRIEVRTKRLNAMTENMQASRDVFLKYTSKRASVANAWKKWQGEVRGLKLNNVMNKKQNYEREFQAWANGNTDMPYQRNLLAKIEASSVAVNDIIKAEEYIKEAVLGIELIQHGATLEKIYTVMKAGLPEPAWKDSVMKIVAGTAGFYKNYDLETDKDVFVALMPLFFERNPSFIPPAYAQQYAEKGSDFGKWADYIYGYSLLQSKNALEQFAKNLTLNDTVRIIGDPGWQLYHGVTVFRKVRIQPVLAAYYDRMSYMNRLYMKGQMEKDKNKTAFYPDANLTLRLTYGKIDGIDPDGPAGYSFQTNLDEVVAKDNPSVDEFRVPAKLKQLHSSKDYGRWAVNGTVPTCFIASNHTTGGNSGSPVLNAKGELIGTNFDRIWEGTMSDLHFDPRLCRNITLDIRYTLFVVEKFGNAGWLLKEMKFAKK